MFQTVGATDLANVAQPCPLESRLIRLGSHNGTTGSASQTWVMLRIGRQAVQSHKRKEPVYEADKICGIGCPCRYDCGSGSRAGGRGTLPGDHSESRGVRSQTSRETGAGRAAAVLL